MLHSKGRIIHPQFVEFVIHPEVDPYKDIPKLPGQGDPSFSPSPHIGWISCEDLDRGKSNITLNGNFKLVVQGVVISVNIFPCCETTYMYRVGICIAILYTYIYTSLCDQSYCCTLQVLKKLVVLL